MEWDESSDDSSPENLSQAEIDEFVRQHAPPPIDLTHRKTITIKSFANIASANCNQIVEKQLNAINLSPTVKTEETQKTTATILKIQNEPTQIAKKTPQNAKEKPNPIDSTTQKTITVKSFASIANFNNESTPQVNDNPTDEKLCVMDAQKSSNAKIEQTATVPKAEDIAQKTRENDPNPVEKKEFNNNDLQACHGAVKKTKPKAATPPSWNFTADQMKAFREIHNNCTQAEFEDILTILRATCTPKKCLKLWKDACAKSRLKQPGFFLGEWEPACRHTQKLMLSPSQPGLALQVFTNIVLNAWDVHAQVEKIVALAPQLADEPKSSRHQRHALLKKAAKERETDDFVATLPPELQIFLTLSRAASAEKQRFEGVLRRMHSNSSHKGHSDLTKMLLTLNKLEAQSARTKVLAMAPFELRSLFDKLRMDPRRPLRALELALAETIKKNGTFSFQHLTEAVNAHLDKRLISGNVHQFMEALYPYLFHQVFKLQAPSKTLTYESGKNAVVVRIEERPKGTVKKMVEGIRCTGEDLMQTYCYYSRSEEDYLNFREDYLNRGLLNLNMNTLLLTKRERKMVRFMERDDSNDYYYYNTRNDDYFDILNRSLAFVELKTIEEIGLSQVIKKKKRKRKVNKKVTMLAVYGNFVLNNLNREMFVNQCNKFLKNGCKSSYGEDVMRYLANSFVNEFLNDVDKVKCNKFFKFEATKRAIFLVECNRLNFSSFNSKLTDYEHRRAIVDEMVRKRDSYKPKTGQPNEAAVQPGEVVEDSALVSNWGGYGGAATENVQKNSLISYVILVCIVLVTVKVIVPFVLLELSTFLCHHFDAIILICIFVYVCTMFFISLSQ